jgi:hypothetical protein
VPGQEGTTQPRTNTKAYDETTRNDFMNKPSRRQIVAGLASGAFAISGASSVFSKAGHLEPSLADNSEYMFEPGLNYLNTAALGPTPRSVLDRVLQAWDELELIL